MEERGRPRARRVSLLAQILANKQREIEELAKLPRRRGHRQTLDVTRALRRSQGGPLKLIAEIKLRSPSAGALHRGLSPADRALAYAEAQASMISVLCDASFFDGAWEHVTEARTRNDAANRAVPILAKEYVLDERQVTEARDRGADAVLLIARIVSRPRLAELAAAARTESIEPLIEVVDEDELDAAVEAGVRVVGVNARDLDTLAMDPARAKRVLAAIPEGLVAVHMSGMREPGDVAGIAAGRVDAALIGEALMRDADPRPRLRAMAEAARS